MLDRGAVGVPSQLDSTAIHPTTAWRAATVVMGVMVSCGADEWVVLKVLKVLKVPPYRIFAVFRVSNRRYCLLDCAPYWCGLISAYTFCSAVSVI